MSDKNCAGILSGASNCAEPVCIHTSKVFEHETNNLFSIKSSAK